jgi:hypothetical protein
MQSQVRRHQQVLQPELGQRRQVTLPEFGLGDANRFGGLVERQSDSRSEETMLGRTGPSLGQFRESIAQSEKVSALVESHKVDLLGRVFDFLVHRQDRICQAEDAPDNQGEPMARDRRKTVILVHLVDIPISFSFEPPSGAYSVIGVSTFAGRFAEVFTAVTAWL